MISKTARFTLSLCLGLCGFIYDARADVLYSDGEFLPSEWEQIVFQKGGGPGINQNGQTIRQATSGGNPGRYRENTVVLEGTVDEEEVVFAIHLKTGAVYNPQSQGALTAVSWSIEGRLFSSTAPLQLVPVKLILRQNGKYYTENGSRTGLSVDSWRTATGNTSMQDDFDEIDLSTLDSDSSKHPDFVTGGEITFGYLNDNRLPLVIQGHSRVEGLDNFNVNLHNGSAPIYPTTAQFKTHRVDGTVCGFIGGLNSKFFAGKIVNGAFQRFDQQIADIKKQLKKKSLKSSKRKKLEASLRSAKRAQKQGAVCDSLFT